MALDDAGGRTITRGDNDRTQQETAIPIADSAEHLGKSGPRMETQSETGDKTAKDVQNEQIAAERGTARAEAFEQMAQGDALARHPELDGAYAKLREERETLADKPVAERDAAYADAKANISNQLRRGEIPAGPVTREESERVIDMAAAERGIKSVRDGDELGRDVKGEVVATSSQHALVAISDDVAVRFEKSALDKDVQAGDRVAIQYEEGKSQVHEQGKEPQADTRDLAHDMAR